VISEPAKEPNIENGRLERSFKTNREHVAHIKEIVKAKENTKECAKCGAEMKIRVVKKGENAGNKFWGCSNFPKCRSMANV
jgi:ssDNA-binding Zn-finger/Zn-ribbon topoisomerase 1